MVALNASVAITQSVEFVGQFLLIANRVMVSPTLASSVTICTILMPASASHWSHHKVQIAFGVTELTHYVPNVLAFTNRSMESVWHLTTYLTASFHFWEVIVRPAQQLTTHLELVPALSLKSEMVLHIASQMIQATLDVCNA
jgi:hypothetical protein